MGFPIFSHDTGTINGKNDRKLLDGNIVNDLVIGALEECGVDSDNGEIA